MTEEIITLSKTELDRISVIQSIIGRRLRLGELVQIDGSPHDWFEGYALRCNLIVFIDDATRRLLDLHFSPTGPLGLIWRHSISSLTRMLAQLPYTVINTVFFGSITPIERVTARG